MQLARKRRGHSEVKGHRPHIRPEQQRLLTKQPPKAPKPGQEPPVKGAALARTSINGEGGRQIVTGVDPSHRGRIY